MKTEIEVKDEVYNYIKSSAIMSVVKGELKKRDSLINNEDVFVSLIYLQGRDEQTAEINVNVYVNDILHDGVYEQDDPRLRVISRTCLEVLESCHGYDWGFRLEKQETFKVQGANQHMLNNRLFYKS